MEKAEFVTNDEYDILIQFTLQPHIVYDGNVKKRIGIFNTETLPHEIARGHLTKELLMDEIWVDSPQLETAVYNTIQNYNPNINYDKINKPLYSKLTFDAKRDKIIKKYFLSLRNKAKIEITNKNLQ